MEKRPNILIILADQHRYDCLGCNGNLDVKTPNLDALAQDGIIYENCCTTFPVCTPARYSFITGLYPHQHLGLSNHSSIPSALPTFPKILKKSGYQTQCIGKMHYTPTYADLGFEKMILAEQDGPGRFDDDYHRYLKEHKLVDKTDLFDQVPEYRMKTSKDYFTNFGTEESNLTDEHYSTTWIGNHACEAIEAWDDGDHLLMVGFIKPHHPFDAPPPWSKMYDPEKLHILPGWTDQILENDGKYKKGYFDYTSLSQTALKKMMAQYYAAISQIDHNIGKMIKILKKKELYDNTLIIYMSDHGDFLGFHHLGLKGNYMYDPLIKIPLIMKYPMNVGKGQRKSELTSIIDISATLIEQSGNILPNTMWGCAIPLGEDHQREYLFAETDTADYMVRSMRYKLLYSQKAPCQFFDLIEDPYELNNLYEKPESQMEIRKMKDALLDWFSKDSTARSYVEENGVIISGPNVPRMDDGHQKQIKNYFKEKMDPFIPK